MKKKLLINLLICVGILGVGVVGLAVLGKRPDVPKKSSADTDDAVPVETDVVRNYEQPIVLKVDGEASTYRVVTVGTEVEGRVIYKAPECRSGSWVAEGVILFRIDPARYQLEVDRLQAQLTQAQEELASVTIDLANTRDLIRLAEEDLVLRQKNLERTRQLHRRQTANDAELEEASRQELMSRNSLQTLTNQVRLLEQQKKTKAAAVNLARVQLARANLDLARCEIRAPLEGRVVDDLVEEGDHLKSGDDLVHISDGARMEIKCQLRGDQLAWIWRQQNAESPVAARTQADPINLPSVPCEVAFEFEGVETIWDGKISRLEGTGIDRETRMFPCRVLIEQPRESRVNNSLGGYSGVQLPALLSGLFVTVRIPVEPHVPVLQVPLEAVRPGGQVWLVRDGHLKIATVPVLHVVGERALIADGAGGVTAGDHVVVSPLAFVKDDLRVRIVSADGDGGQRTETSARVGSAGVPGAREQASAEEGTE